MNSTEKNKAAKTLLSQIRQLARPVRFMEVCGTHTNVIFASGIRSLLPRGVQLISGPGCPVCVTPGTYIDKAIAYAKLPGVILASFGDMLKVPGSVSSLAQAKASGADVRVVYSPLGAVKLASENPRRKIIFLAVGFETTAPATAAAVLTAAGLGLKNFFLLSAHKRISPALKGLLQLAGTQLDGLLLPGHVCMITGLEPFAFLPDEYHRPAVVTGFASLDILLSVCMLLRQATGRPKLENAYPAAVRSEGNQVALRMLADVFEPSDQVWRGLGLIPRSGLALREALRLFDAEHSLPVAVAESAEPDGCRCGDVICGFIEPPACPRFGRSCSPPNPVGACMVSSEGACAAWYKYTHGRWLA